MNGGLDGRERGASSRDEPFLGRLISGRYRVVERLAEGGMGVVYRAEDTVHARTVALKVLHVHLAGDADAAGRFEREARALSAISHPNVVAVQDSGVLPDGRRFLVLELLTGRDLARALREEGPMPVGRVARILAQVADGVAVAHDKGIIHRDLKPENVFLIDDNAGRERVKVMDFGVARYAAAGVEQRTQTGMTVGTPYFMAPEQAQGRRDLDGRVDVYALGVMGFRMLTGHHPFDDESYPMLVVKICTEPPPRIETWRRDVPRELSALLDRMMAKAPGSRPSTMREVRDALLEFSSMDGPPSLTGAPAPAHGLPTLLEPRSRESPLGHTAEATPLDDSTRHDRSRHEELDAAEDETEFHVVVPDRRRAPWILAGLGVSLAVIVGWALSRPDEAPPMTDEPDGIALPEPRAPVVRALSDGGRSQGWAFVNPRPRVMPAWHAVATAGPGIVAMVGAHGMAAHLVDGLLLTWRTGTDRALHGVAWTSAEHALAVGEGGVMVRLTPEGPRAVASGTERTLRAVASVSATEAIAVGDDGTALRILGDRILAIPVEGSPDLFAVHAHAGEATLVGEAGTILRVVDGRARRIDRPTSQTLRAVGGCDRDLYVAGDEGVLLRATGSSESPSFRPVRLDPPTRASFVAIGCDRGRTVVVGTEGEVRLVSGLRSVRLDSGFDGTFTGVSGAADEATWIVGTSGRLAVVVSDHVETRVSGPVASLRDVADIGGALVAVGDWGKIIRQRERGLELEQAPTEAGLGALARLGDGSLIAVGDGGTIVRLRFDAAELVSSPTDHALRGIVAEAETLLAVGADGIVLRGPLSALVPTYLAGRPDLAAIAGTPSDAIAVGDAGAIVRLTTAGSRRIDCGRSWSLRGVVRESPAGPAFAVGESATIVRIDSDDSCALEHRLEGAPTLHGIGRGPDGRLLAVGDAGTAYVRGDDGTWTPVDLDIGLVSLRAVRSIDPWVFIVGAGGVILRHIRVDGG